MRPIAIEAEIDAAMSAAEKAGLGPVTPELLHVGNHTSVRLSPLPVVARVATGTSFDLSPAAVAHELVIGMHLASRGAPAARPYRSAPGPFLEKDCAVTFWEFVQGREVASKLDATNAATALKRVHSALADLDAAVPSFITKVESCEAILTSPVEAPSLASSDRSFLLRLYEKFEQELRRVEGSWQRLHGDTHLGNVLMTRSGALWMDLEAVCVGPLEWDVVNLPRSTWSLFGTIDSALMRLFTNLRSLCLAVWCWSEFDRSRASAEAAVHHLRKLQHRFS